MTTEIPDDAQWALALLPDPELTAVFGDTDCESIDTQFYQDEQFTVVDVADSALRGATPHDCPFCLRGYFLRVGLVAE